MPEAPGKHDQFGVDVRPGEVEHFHADLVELAVAAFLRLLVAKHRAGVPQLLHLATAGEAVLKDGTHATGRAFGTQGQRLFVAVEEGVHLLVDHVGALADAPGEQLGELKDGQADFLVAIAVEQRGEGVFQVAPGRGLLRQDVVHATDGLEGLAHGVSLFSCGR